MRSEWCTISCRTSITLVAALRRPIELKGALLRTHTALVASPTHFDRCPYPPYPPSPP
jgi:hypothetical protein